METLQFHLNKKINKNNFLIESIMSGTFGQYQDLLLSKLSNLNDASTSNTIMTATTDVADHATAKRLLCDEDGHLQVDVVSMSGGGDASAANQTAGNESLADILTELQTPTALASENSLQAVDSSIQSLSSDIGDVVSAVQDLDTPIQDVGSSVNNVDASVQSVESAIGMMSLKLPLALSSNGNLQVSIEEGGVETQLPTALSSAGNLKVSIEEGAGSLATSALQTVGNASLSSIASNLLPAATAANQATLSAKLPTAPDSDGRLMVAGKAVSNVAVASIATSVAIGGSQNVSWNTDGYRSVNIYGGVSVGQSISTGSGYGVYVIIENSPDNTNWYFYKELYINNGMNYENNIANVETVIAPYMRMTMTNDDSVARQANLYVHGIKSRD